VAVYFRTSAPTRLLSEFNRRIAQIEPMGKITTWARHKQGSVDFYTHKANDWAGKAYFTPVVEDGVLRFNIIRPKDGGIDGRVYAYYHGHLTETFLAHFDQEFTDAISSALPRAGDACSGT